MDRSHYTYAKKKVKHTADKAAVVKGVPFRMETGQQLFIASHTKLDIALAVGT